jgi:hypothetical protein
MDEICSTHGEPRNGQTNLDMKERGNLGDLCAKRREVFKRVFGLGNMN